MWVYILYELEELRRLQMLVLMIVVGNVTEGGKVKPVRMVMPQIL